MAFHRDNHYVPSVYLRGFAGSDDKVHAYRLLVPHERVRLWKANSVKGLAYHSHLYTRLVAGQESDEFETWLDHEIESPAAECLNRVLADGKLCSEDWRRLIRFLAAQIVRTPAHLLENLPRWEANTERLLDSTLKDSVAEIERAKKENRPVQTRPSPNSEYLPIRVTMEKRPEENVVAVKANMIVGRSLWLFSIKNALTRTVKVLYDHDWTILTPARGKTWFTSDDPVVRLNYEDEGKFNFKGGWNQKGTEILMPLSPNHLMYTRVGHKPPLRGTELSDSITAGLRRMIAVHAHRLIIAAAADPEVERLRPRVIDAEAVRWEQDQWNKWHQDQSDAEARL